MLRTVQMEALRYHYEPAGPPVEKGDTFFATEKEAEDYRTRSPHLAKRVSVVVHVPPGEMADASPDPAEAWVATGITMTPQQYLDKFKGAGDHAEVARAALGLTAQKDGGEEPVKAPKGAKAKSAETSTEPQ